MRSGRDDETGNHPDATASSGGETGRLGPAPGGNSRGRVIQAEAVGDACRRHHAAHLSSPYRTCLSELAGGQDNHGPKRQGDGPGAEVPITETTGPVTSTTARQARDKDPGCTGLSEGVTFDSDIAPIPA